MNNMEYTESQNGSNGSNKIHIDMSASLDMIKNNIKMKNDKRMANCMDIRKQLLGIMGDMDNEKKQKINKAHQSLATAAVSTEADEIVKLLIHSYFTNIGTGISKGLEKLIKKINIPEKEAKILLKPNGEPGFSVHPNKKDEINNMLSSAANQIIHPVEYNQDQQNYKRRKENAPAISPSWVRTGPSI